MLHTILVTPWSSAFFTGNTLDYMAILIPAAIAAALAFRAGLCNLGIEGQIYAGGCAAGVFLLHAGHEGGAAALVVAAALCAMLTGGLLAFICAVLKRVCGASEMISSFLLSASITPVVDYLIAGPLRDTSANLLATPPLAPAFLLPRLMPPSSLSISFIITLLLPVAAWIFLNGTATGYRFRLMGKSPDFARYGGINAEQYWLPAMGLSGALAGLSGFFAVTGTYGILHLGWTGGLGWAGIACALIAGSRSLALLPATFFYAYLKSGVDTALLISGVRFQSASLIQAAVLFAVTAKWARLVPRRGKAAV